MEIIIIMNLKHNEYKVVISFLQIHTGVLQKLKRNRYTPSFSSRNASDYISAYSAIRNLFETHFFYYTINLKSI